jgi:hypothetical protein
MSFAVCIPAMQSMDIYALLFSVVMLIPTDSYL